MTVQLDLCRTCSETTLLVFQRGGSFIRTCKAIPSTVNTSFNPSMTNGLSHIYHLDKSTLIFGDIRCDFRFWFKNLSTCQPVDLSTLSTCQHVYLSTCRSVNILLVITCVQYTSDVLSALIIVYDSSLPQTLRNTHFCVSVIVYYCICCCTSIFQAQLLKLRLGINNVSSMICMQYPSIL